MDWLRRYRRRQPAEPAAAAEVSADTQSRLAAVQVAVSEAAAGGREVLDRLIEVLADLDAVDGDHVARAGLDPLVSSPKIVARLDEHSRRVLRYSSYHSPVLDRLAARLREGTPGPVAVALASMHGNGRVRERAVKAMLAQPCPQLMPFLVLRACDWVRQVRDRARAGLARLLVGDPGEYLPAALPMILQVEPRARGGFGHAQALAALVRAPADVRQALAGAADRRQRRFVFDTALALGWLRLNELVTAAESDDDVRIWVRAAEAACREAVWTRQIAVLHRLARSRRAQVRAVALTGLARMGHDTEVAGFLDDDASLVRAVARDAARRLGLDALAHYRASVTKVTPATGAIAGLAETGSGSDAALLRPLLAHASPRVRAQAVQALRQLDAVDVEQMLPLLRDPAPAVVREASAALRPLRHRLPAGLGWQLLADPRVERRRAGYRLLPVPDIATQLRAALILATDLDARLARRGKADVTRLARDAVQSSRRRQPRPEPVFTAEQQAELTDLVHRASETLGADTTRLLITWLATTQVDR